MDEARHRKKKSSGAGIERELSGTEEEMEEKESSLQKIGEHAKDLVEKAVADIRDGPDSSGREQGVTVEEPEILSWLYEEINDPNEFFHKLLPSSAAREVLRAFKDVSPSYYLHRLEVFRWLLPDMLPIPQTVSLVSKAWQRHKKIVQQFSNLNREEGLMQLCNLSSLTIPCFSDTLFSPPLSFTYVGRPKLRSLLKEVKVQSDIHFQGHPGRGKSYVLAALASYLYTYEQECSDRLYSFVRAGSVGGEADVCFGSNWKCWHVTPWESSKSFARRKCSGRRCQSVYNEEDCRVAREYLSWIVNRSRAVWCTTYKEFTSWLAGYNFKELDINDLLFYTGLIPRQLAKFVAKGTPEPALYRRRRDSYIADMRRVFKYFVERMTMEEADAVEKVLDLGFERITLDYVSIVRLRKGVCFVTATSVDMVIIIMSADEKSLDIHPSSVFNGPVHLTPQGVQTYVVTNTEGANLGNEHVTL
ncbi:hypothetical protein SELMODRAFT_451551 [Selaginella moellendorffii]|uniref:Uncharacterized protein n=1 Tax=Selaginella moellendorffii TaxID=88036 RepID=D8SVG7_SELML|nr:hypothetical protein SELMODRAFT_451551 [Selaginella moellendorffii]